MRRGVSSIGIAFVVFGTACSFLVDANKEQCTTDSDCTARGASFAGAICKDSKCIAKPAPEDSGSPIEDAGAADAPTGPWRCVGTVAWEKVNLSRTITLVQHFNDFVSGQPLANVGLKACLRADVACANPFSTATTDDAGSAPLRLPYAFDGYWLLLPPPNSSPELITMLIHELPPPVKELEDAPPTQPISRSNLTTLASLAGVSMDPERGHMTVSIVDCDGHRVPGISIEADPTDEKTKIFYLENKLPNLTRTFTDSEATVGLSNLQPGVVTITAKIADTGTVVARYAALVQADKLTSFILPPTPTTN